MDDTRPFPIQGELSYKDSEGYRVYPKESNILWWLAEEAYRDYAAKFGTSQSYNALPIAVALDGKSY